MQILNHRTLLYYIFVFLFSVVLFGKTNDQILRFTPTDGLNKLHPHLLSILKESEKPTLQKKHTYLPKIRSIAKGPSQEPLYGVIIYTWNPNALFRAGIKVNSVYSNFVTARVSIPILDQLIDNPNIQYIEGI